MRGWPKRRGSPTALSMALDVFRGITLGVSLVGLAGLPARGEPSPAIPAQSLALAPRCASEIEPLVTQLMVDLPSYGNRVIHSARAMGEPGPLYLIVAGQAVVTPIAPAEFANAPQASRLPSDSAQHPRTNGEEVYQVTFTTLERQYLRPRKHLTPAIANAANPAIEQQQKHWLILARRVTVAASPWQIISLRSQLIPYPAAGNILAPPQSSRPGPIGQGLATWLRDQQHPLSAGICSSPSPARQT